MAHNTADADADVKEQLGIGATGARRRGLRRWILWAVLILVVAIPSIAALRSGTGKATIEYQTEAVRRGDLTVSVTATGSLASLVDVTVGTEISGIIDKVMVDYNDEVKTGQILATINTEKLESQAAQAKAALESAQAKLLEAQATTLEARTEMKRLQQVHDLSGGKVPSQHDIDAQIATVRRAEADEASAKAAVTQSQGSLGSILVDIRKAVIRSPIDGVVLDREVTTGQTVAASFSTPTLFKLAQDLTRMKLEVNVDEADVGSVRLGQHATFRVDAYPNRTFESVVTQVRNTATTTSGVVTYVTVLSVDNSGRLLRPGMTATAEIEVTHVSDALLVPNAALRFVPPESVLAGQAADAAKKKDSGGSLLGSLMPRPRDNDTKVETGVTSGRQTLWVLADGVPVQRSVTGGVTDGKYTQVLSGQLPVGSAAIVDAVTKK